MGGDIRQRLAELLTPALVFHTDIKVESASGLYVEDSEGGRYMDFASGLATTNAGHCPSGVVEAVKAQASKLLHSGCIFLYDSIVELAERLKEITPPGIEMFFFSNSGAEAVEGAVKLARHVTGRQGIVAFTGGFHGRTLGAVSLTSSTAKYRRLYHPLLPSVLHSPYPYCYRCFFGRERATCSLECFTYFERMLEHLITPEEVACVIIEPVLGEGGYAPAPKEFLMRLKDFCKDNGILFIADEVQTGFGRTGEWFASTHYGIEPDIMTMAKGIASGLPLSVVASSKEIMRRWPPGAHGTTFGGNPVSCAAASATIDIIQSQGLLENAKRVGGYALERLKAMKERLNAIGDVRGIGLMIGVELVKADGSPDRELTEKVIKSCLQNGLVLVECGTHKNVIRMMPPLVTTESEMKSALDIFEEALG